MTQLKAGILNVAYSPNLGDGLIAECLRYGLTSSAAAIEARFIDLAGRESFSQGLKSKQRFNAIRAMLPTFALGFASRLFLSLLVQFRLKPFYLRKMVGLDAVILGGGNLLADQDLNFPKKIHCALMAAARLRLPVYLYGVGVSDDWSPTGRRLFLEALNACDLRFISVRDARSARLLEQALSPSKRDIVTVLDPGVFAALAMPPEAKNPPLPDGVRRIGVGVMSPSELKYHGLSSMDDQVLFDFYLTLFAELGARGFQVAVFTNGSPEDRAFAKQLSRSVGEDAETQAWFSDASDRIQSPTDLCQFIATCSGIVAFRLHAIIAAFSYDKPFVALEWDKKVGAFLSEVKRPGAIANIAESSGASVLDMLLPGLNPSADLSSRAFAQRSLQSVHQLGALIGQQQQRHAHEHLNR
ncbi:polysaccharide pyruvyl transferase family protein [Hydrogenophaga sp. A37]|uniref:polysaccharide pyruvyl transferase family protein n=1 Tax=Hydrogenophaga sp. A37 TaxID=1945864 RepID=UPI00098506EE|nr:polysaccharide pyruvyl transferase family protein [Hydrogenophaga sp. A37]OOG89012.1 hypothetical protein B0E41_01090 [Hydrogenophaga sp. A37]